jgi:ABC-2 type transport system ATP-binding protein
MERNNAKAILEVRGLSKEYKSSGFRLDNISFDLPSGAIMGLIGENGSGKTTTIGCILGSLIKDSGMVNVFGKEMTDENADIRNDIGVVLDGNNFSEDLTALKISSVMRLIYSNWDDGLFNECLKRFGLPARQRLKTFSKGMMVKLGIAAALSHHPKLLVLDEATSGLDPVIRDEILDMFLDFIQDEGHAILVSSNITTDLEKIADYITFIHNGRVLFAEKKDNLIYNYGVVRCEAGRFAEIGRDDILAYIKRDYQIDALVADKQAAERKYRGFIVDNASIDEIMILLVKGEKP